jgi:hypothetical protein
MENQLTDIINKLSTLKEIDVVERISVIEKLSQSPARTLYGHNLLGEDAAFVFCSRTAPHKVIMKLVCFKKK